jgi:hypothetical protein
MLSKAIFEQFHLIFYLFLFGDKQKCAELALETNKNCLFQKNIHKKRFAVLLPEPILRSRVTTPAL